jgi:hypothetical protein
VKKFVAVLAGLSVVAGGIVFSAVPSQALTTETGLACTIQGNARDNRIVGTSGNDVICGLGGNDVIDGAGGDDVIDGGLGNDSMSGGQGSDTITGSAGNDRLFGGDGDDRLEGGAGNDYVEGDAGSDGLVGGIGADTLLGGLPGQTLADAGDLCEPVSVGDSVAACGFDDEAPHIVSYSLSSTTIDTSVAAQTVSIDVHATDDLLGVSKLNCAAQLQGSSGVTLPAFGSLFPASSRVSGTAVDSIRRCPLVFPKSSPQGTWLISIEVYDSMGQSESISAYNSDSWTTRFGSGNLGTITQTGAGDAQAPLIRSITLSRTTINTEGVFVNPRPGTAYGNRALVNARIVDITMDVSDDLAGLKMVQCGLRFQNDVSVSVETATKVSGTALRSVWKCSVRMTDFSPQGRWYLVATVADSVGHIKNLRGVSSGVNEGYIGSALEASEATGLGRNYIEQTGRGDNTAPVVSSFSVTPITVNTSSASKTIVHTFNLTDDVSGVQSVSCSLSHTVNFRTTSGPSFSGKLISGTRLNGVWSCSVILPRGSARGEWSINWWTRDVARNQKGFSGNGGAQNGWRGTNLSDAESALPFISVTNG